MSNKGWSNFWHVPEEEEYVTPADAQADIDWCLARLDSLPLNNCERIALAKRWGVPLHLLE